MSETEDTTEKQTNEQAAGDTQELDLGFLLGKKRQMTQVFDESGNVQPATVVDISPLTVVQVKTEESDGYNAYQLGFGSKSEKNTASAQQGHVDSALEDRDEYFEVLQEYRLAETPDTEAVGSEAGISTFSVGDKVDVSGITKGKGFQGVVKRHGFAGGRRSHGGQKSPERGPGSIGATGPKRVLKGTKMAGRMGARRKTIQNLEVVHIDEDEGLLYIKGGLPGRNDTLLEIHTAR